MSDKPKCKCGGKMIRLYYRVVNTLGQGYLVRMCDRCGKTIERKRNQVRLGHERD